MKAKVFACLLALVMVLGLLPSAGAEGTDQVINVGGSVLYNTDGRQVTGSELGENGSVVKITKTIEQYAENNQKVENEFVVTLQVQTSENIKQIASDTPDSAVLLVMDVSNSMDDCVNCGEELDHRNHSGTSTTTYYCPNNSGDTYQPGWRGRCSNCGYNQSYHRVETTHTGGTCGYQARLAATKVAAKDFLHEFAYETGEQDGDKRMVAIVAYATHAVTVRDWVDITSTEGMYAAEQAIDGLTIANNNQSQWSGLRGGGTSIESGLALGRNLLGQSAVSEIDYRYTILLTDGQPTYPASDANSTRTDYVYGSTGNSGSSTQEADMDNVAAIAQAICNMSKLYSVCFGKVDNADVWDMKPFGNWSGSYPTWSTTDDTTVGAWLNSFSTAAYKAADASSANLFDVFSSIMAQIQVAAKAWKVEDWMGDHMVYGEPVPVSKSNGGYVANRVNTPNPEDYTGTAPAFVWDLLGSENDSDTNWDTSSSTGLLSYTYKYRVTLDNLDSRYSTEDENNDDMGDGDEAKPSNTITNANTLATLRYATTDENGNWPDSTDDYKTAAFPVPTVKGLVGNLTFTKMVENPSSEDTTTPQPLEGITFRLRSKDSVANPNDANLWAYVDATSDENGVVTFTGIPSGHEYTLLEAESESEDIYVDLGDIPVSISWGTAVVDSTFKNENGSLVLYNTYDADALGQITLQKNFDANNVKPHSIQFKINGKAGTDAAGYSAQRSLYASDAVQGDANTWSWTLKGLRFGEYTIEEINALDIHGNQLRDTHDLSYEIYVDGAATPSKSGTFVEGTESTYPKIDVTLSSNDSDKHVTVKFVNNMTPKQGTLSISKRFVDLPEDMVDANMGLNMQVIATSVDANGAPIVDASPVVMELNYVNGAYVASATLPIGHYKLTETITGSVPGYSLLHYVFAQNNANIENGIVEITDDVTLNVTLKNHYQQDTAHMHIIKKFDGDLAADAFAERVIYVNVYNYDTVNQTKVGEPVATIQLDGGDGSWTTATPELPLGYYYLEEVIAEGEAGTAYTDGYAHKVTWNPGHVVELTTKDQAVNLTLTNTYDRDKGYIQVTKTFAQDSELNAQYFVDNNKPITIAIYNAGETATGTPVDTLTLPCNDGAGQLVWNDTSIALPVGDYELVETGHMVDGYSIEQTWTGVKPGATNTFEVTANNTSAITLENKYTQDKGTLTVTKAFEGLPDEVKNGLTVTINILMNDQNSVLVGSIELTKDNSWTATIALPVGEYRIEESVTDVEGYTLKDAAWTGVTDGKITIAKNASISVSVKNTYTDDYGYLTINKVLTGQETLDNEFTFKITSEDQNESVAIVTVGSNGRGSETVNLPVGKYTVEELISSTEDSRYKISYASDSNGVVINGSSVTVDVTSGAQISFTCTNTNLPRLSVKVPLEKTVKVTGNTVPDQKTFSFGAEWSNPAQLPIDVDFVNEDGNTIGEVKKTATNAYTITVNGEGTVKGYIVIRGFADDLNGFELTTWEKLNPYGNVQAMKDAHWNYDQTAQNSSLRWKVTFNKVDDHSVSYDIALGQEDGKSRIAFENVYEEVDVPELPATGDEDMPLLWALLIVLSVGGLVLLRKKFAR